MYKLLTILFLLITSASFGQVLNNVPEYKKGVKANKVFLERHKGALPVPADTTPFVIMADSSVKLWDGTQYKDIGTGGSSGSTIINGGPTTSTPSAGFNPGTNISIDEFIQKAYYASQGPTSGISGGQQMELMASGAALSFNLNWTAGRQSATQPIQSIIVAGVSQTFTTPAAGGSISGSKSVSVVRNTNTTFSNIVTATDGKSATSTTSFTFLPKRYFGWVNSTAPTDANIIAAGGELSTAIFKSWIQPAPTGAQFLMYAYPASEGVLNRFDINTFPSLPSMQLTQRNLTNASGFTQLYNIYVSTNAFTVSSTTSIVADGGQLQ